ncbi:MAG TPA: hypothetical protein VGN13_12270 [Solirubrobacteraceae bacterium]|jgi:hypothetical protein
MRPTPPRARRREEATYTFGFDHGEPATCFLARFTDTPCSGRLERCHLIARQTIKREVQLPEGDERDFREILWDPRVWVPGCVFHHGQLDMARKIRLARGDLPVGVEEFACEFGLVWVLDRVFGPRKGAA